VGSVLYEKDGHVATITLNRPDKLNTLTLEMTRQLQEAVHQANADDEVRILVLTGMGDKAFCAGSDIRTLDQYGSNWAFRNRPDYCDALRQLRKPVIAMVRGYALGGGLELALCADIRFAGKSAQFGAVEIKLGWIGGGGITQLLTHQLGYGRAMKMILSGEFVGAEEALRIGLVEDVLPDEELQAYTYEFARTVASYSPIALQTAKHGCRMALSVPLEAGIMYERDMQTICFYTEDSKEGIAAFKEKRKPNFRGE